MCLLVRVCFKKVGFMKNGRITAADFQYYANGGNTGDESVVVRALDFCDV